MDFKIELENIRHRALKSKKEQFQLSEAQLAYMMIAPAVIIIVTIAIYPVLQSFQYSLFDVRLNHPTKNAIYVTSHLNMEKYFSNYDAATELLNTSAREASGDSKGILTEHLRTLESANTKLLRQGDIAAKENEVRQFTDKGRNVEKEVLKFSSLDTESAKALFAEFATVSDDLKKVKSNVPIRNNVQQVSELVGELRDSIITPNFVGLTNYAYYLNPNNKEFWGALGYTFFFTVVSVFFELILGMMIALVINRHFKGIGIVRAAVLVPWAIPTVVAALLWKFLYDGQTGFMAHLLANLHLIENSGVLLTTHIGASFAIIFADVWKTSPYMALLLFAGLQTIDPSLYEAADIDGATKIQKFFHITLPLVKPAILVALLFRTLEAFRVFDLVAVLTGGANNTETISTFAYKTMFAQMEFGRGSTLAVIVFICITLISVGYIKIIGTGLASDAK